MTRLDSGAHRPHRPVAKAWLGIVTALATLLLLAVAAPAHAAAGSDTLGPGERLNPGERIVSTSGTYAAVMQGDGNFVLYGPHGALWASGTDQHGAPAFVIMQTDGNLVVYGNGSPAWWTRTSSRSGATRLVMQNDGNLVIYDGGVALWSSGTAAAASVPTDQQLAQRILGSGHVTGDSRYMAQLRAYAKGDTRCHINPTILALIDQTVAPASAGGLGHTVYISSLNRYCTKVVTSSGTGSYHYRSGGGHAVDFAVVDGRASTGWSPTDLQLIRQLMTRVPSGSGFGQSDCRAAHRVSVTMPAGISQFPDTCNHVHVQVPVR